MPVEFSHYEARIGCRVVRGIHASPMRRLYGKIRAVFVAMPDRPRQMQRRPPGPVAA